MIVLAHHLGVSIFLEQPLSSVMDEHDRMQWLLKRVVIYMVTEYLGHHGANTAKPVKLYSNRSAIGEITAYRSVLALPTRTKTAKTYYNSKGEKTVDGVAHALKASQEYPDGFGVAVAELLKKLRRQSGACGQGVIAEGVAEEDPCGVAEEAGISLAFLLGPEPHASDDWERWADARLDRVFLLLRDVAVRRWTTK